MNKPLTDLKKSMDLLAVRFEKNANKLMIDIGAMAGTEMSKENPIDTGLSSGNWVASISTPITSSQESYYPAASQAKMNAFRSTVKTTGVPVFVANNLDYIQDLNNGSSPQAVSGWIGRASVRSIKKIVPKAKILKR